ncbi:MAG: UDP-N-acetylmuramate dehydrogenase [Tindallia sp. MSAO_Bac2]|nr:MAG: UDP-N-acetylmuramate dehydrogenase [Tindallia sp. MSAO_Bac2]
MLNEPMSKHTSFQIGGPADAMVLPQTTEEIIKSLKFCEEKRIPVTVMGNGSNLLVKDRGIEGLVIKISSPMKEVVIEDENVYAKAGISLSCLANQLQEKSLAGFEFASGIPGTLGGALTMNAGAYGGEMKGIFVECKTIDRNGRIRIRTRTDMEMGYRSSIIQKTGEIIVEATLKLQHGDAEDIKSITSDYWKRRLTKQPYNLPSGGSVFKRPEGFFAGKLIEDCGLKGYSVGGAMVSDLHAGFIVNTGGATATDVLSLMETIKESVNEKFKVELESELRIIGR